MSTRAIRTSTQQTVCDVCGRTLLRGERAEIYLSGATRHSVCELCTARALHGGWVREGTLPDYEQSGDRVERRRSLLRRRRSRRGAEASEPLEAPDEGTESSPGTTPLALPEFGPDPASPAGAGSPEEPERPGTPEWPEPSARASRSRRRRRPAPFSARAENGREPAAVREPRHVHAVPTSTEHKIEAAVELFNASEHPRTVAGITRSLGLPDVSVHPTSPVGAIVNVVAAWELCWYRYEIDLSAGVPVVRGVGQGYELTELSSQEQQANVTVDSQGRLAPARSTEIGTNE